MYAPFPPRDTYYYDTLHLPFTANGDEIKTAYRKLALQYHPDKNSSSEAPEMFKKIAEAYEVLSDKTKRRIYDTQGREGMHQTEQCDESASFSHFSSPRNPMDIFSQFFGFRATDEETEASEEEKHHNTRKPRDKLIVIELSLEEIYCGTTKRIFVKRRCRCPHCLGTRCVDQQRHSSCPTCLGEGVIMDMFLPQYVCPACGGSGIPPEIRQCKMCIQGIVICEKEFTLEVPRGVADGDSQRCIGEGDEFADSIASGDILIVFEELPHAKFTRMRKPSSASSTSSSSSQDKQDDVHTHEDEKGDDLWLRRCRIPLMMALRGLCLPFEHLDGRIIEVRMEDGQTVCPQYVYYLPGYGMPACEMNKTGERKIHINRTKGAAVFSSFSSPISFSGDASAGRLYLDIEIVFPFSRLTLKQQSQVAVVFNNNNNYSDDEKCSHDYTNPDNNNNVYYNENEANNYGKNEIHKISATHEMSPLSKSVIAPNSTTSHI